MSTPINLNKARKARARSEKSARGDANAASFGLTKTQREHAKQENSRAARALSEKTVERPVERPVTGEKDGHEKT